MPMEIDRAMLKGRAKESMSLAKPNFWIVTMVYLLMTTGVSTLSNLAPGSFGLFLTFAITMYSWVVGFSYRLWALWTCRRLEPGLGSLMEGFSVAGRVVIMELGILGRVMGWTILLSLGVSVLIMAVPSPLMMAVAMGGVVLAVQVIALRYTLAPYVLADYPDLGGGIAVAHGARLARGWVFELLKLHLSFAGWYILSFVLSLLGMVAGLALGGDLSGLAALPFDQLIPAVEELFYASPLAASLGSLFALPVTPYFTPYLEVTMAEFYNARIALPDNMADPLAGTRPPV